MLRTGENATFVEPEKVAPGSRKWLSLTLFWSLQFGATKEVEPKKDKPSDQPTKRTGNAGATQRNKLAGRGPELGEFTSSDIKLEQFWGDANSLVLPEIKQLEIVFRWVSISQRKGCEVKCGGVGCHYLRIAANSRSSDPSA